MEQKQITDLRIAVVCSSNQNRSMEAHAFLSKKGFKVRSFGTGNQVKLPGPTADKPNLYDFDTSYEEMYSDLVSKDKLLYTQNGLLHMLDRNRRIKPHPEQFQTCADIFDVIFTAEERVYDQVVEGRSDPHPMPRLAEPCAELASRIPVDNSPVHVINIDIMDNHEEATIGAFLICELVQLLSSCEDLDNEIDDILQEFESKTQRTILHTVQFY